MSCSQSDDGDLCCSLQIVDTVLIYLYIETLSLYCPEAVPQHGLRFEPWTSSQS